MPRQKSIILFGEGKTEAVFLKHLHSLYANEIKARVKIDAGQGGSPKQVVTRLINKHLAIAAYDRSLLLIDEGLPSDEIPVSWLAKHKIQLTVSSPMCLEGLLLTILNDAPPSRERRISKNWKRRFHNKYFGTDRDSEVMDRLRRKCGELSVFGGNLGDKFFLGGLELGAGGGRFVGEG